MADSGDDEYDRKRRDKFRGERAADAAYSSRGSERAVRARDDWPERDGWSRPRPRDYAGRVRDRGYSPSIEPAMKRPRTDYYGGGGGDYFGSGGSFAAASAYHPVPHRREVAANQVTASTGGDSGSGQPPMLSFKAFLATQDDNISDSEAIEKYNDYKLEFQRQQLNEFFVAHKDDEWFRIKYHPDDSAKRKEEQSNFIKKRVGIFEELFKEGRLSTSLDCVHTNALVKLLDTVVIKLEGGGEEDITALDKEYEEKEEPRTKDKEDKKNETKENKDSETKNNDKEDGEDGELEDDKKEDNKSDADEKDTNENVNGEDVDMHENASVDDVEDNKVKGINKNKRQHNNLDSDDGMEKQDLPEKVNIECEEQVEEDLEENIEEIKDKKSKDDEEKEEECPKAAEDKNKDTIRAPKDKKRKRSRSFSGSSSSSSSSGSGSSSESETDNEKVKDKEKDNDQCKSDEAKEKTNVKKNNPNEGEKGLSNIEDKVLNTEKDNATDENEEDKSIIVKIKNEDDKDKKEDKRPPPLHKTTSIFLRSLAPSITRQEVEAMCSRYAGFLRVALADPQPERRWQRRGWVTFRRDANIKEICWALNNARLRDCDLGAIMNRDLSRRIRPVSGIVAHRSVVRMDIRVSARVAVHMDDKYGLWKKDGEQDEASASIEKEEKFTPFGFLSRNPVLHNITDYLIEEASAEEDLLLGLEPTGGDDIGAADGTNVQIERDDALISVLDRIVLYLRIVHSIDYYNHCEYPNEDEMPSRCGILHARGPTPTARADITHLLGTQAESRMANFLPEVANANDVLAQGGGSKQHDNKKTDNEHKLITLAMKDVDGEIDKFVQANTRELAKDKWLCPLSGKKFKGPDFVRKHIFNKHAEKIEEVKKEVEFFNNYLKDVKRPASADQHQHQQQQQQQQQAKREEMPNNSSLGGYLGGGHQPQHPRSYGAYGGGYMGGRYGGGGYGGYSRPHRGGYAHRARGGAAGGTATDYRPIIHYRDLDAPREPEEFI